MVKQDYLNIIPISLYLVLNSIDFKNKSNIANWSGPILYNEGYNYSSNIRQYVTGTTVTPGGINPSVLDETLKLKLL